MSKKVGDRITARCGSGYDGTPESKGTGKEPIKEELTVTKVFQHGVRTKEMGYINNKRITGHTPKE